MTTFRQLSPALRAAITAPWLCLAAALALGATPAFRQLLLDAANQPTADVSLSSAHWTGTLDAARLPGRVVQYSETGNVPVGFGVAFVGSGGSGLNLNDEASSDGNQNWQFPGTISADGLSVGDRFFSDGNLVSTDGSGGLTVDSLSVVNGAYFHGPIDFNQPVEFGSDVEFDHAVTITDVLRTNSDVYLAGTLFAGTGPVVDPVGELYYANGGLLNDLSGNLFDAAGNVIADGTGNLYAINSFGVWGASPPVVQPDGIADATNLASVIAGFNTLKADLISYGLIARQPASF